MNKYNYNLFLNPERYNRRHKYSQGLSFWWLTLNGLSGARPYDIVSEIHGVSTGSPTLNNSKYGGYNFAFGNYFEFGDTLPTQTTQTTFSASCMMSTVQNTGSFQGICGKGYLAASSGGWGLYVNGANASCQVRSGGTTSVIDSSTSITTGAPFHLMITRVPNLTTLYVNGVSVGTETTALTVANDATAFCIGKNPPGSFPYTGRINDVRFWKNYAWSASDVMKIYQDIQTGYQQTLSWNQDFLYSLPNSAVVGGGDTRFFSLLFGGGF